MQSERSSQSEPDASADPVVRSRPRRRWLRALLVLALGYAMVCAALVYWETRLVFPGAYFDASGWMDPNRFNPDQPIVGKVVGFDYQAIDESILPGRLIVRQDAKRVILFLHGNGIRANEMDGWAVRLSEVFDATVLVAEYRGYQASDFTPSEQSTFEDAVAAIDALAEMSDTPTEEILVYGRSLGGGVAAGLVEAMIKRGTPPKSIILDRTFDSVADVGADMFWFLPVRRLIQNRFDSAVRLHDFRGNVVQIHGVPDRIVPMRNGRRLHRELTTPSRTWIEVPDMRHNDRISLRSLERLREELEILEAKQTE